MSSQVKPPAHLRGDNIVQRILREEVWEPTNLDNQWRMFCIVGREGSGKSGTMLSILEAVDPSFSADRVYFDAGEFMEAIDGMSKAERAGTAIAIDEAGVGMGTRSWYDQEQIQLNKMLQTARDDNMIVGMSLPRLNELDSQTRGRLHAVLEMKTMSKGDHARFKWFFWEPSRDERDKTYRMSPRSQLAGRKTKMRTLAIGPPTSELFAAYNERKQEFKEELYAETTEMLQDGADGGDDMGPKDIAAEIKEAGVPEDYIAVHGGNGRRYLDGDMIQMDYECSARDAKKAKKLLERDDEVTIE